MRCHTMHLGPDFSSNQKHRGGGCNTTKFLQEFIFLVSQRILLP